MRPEESSAHPRVARPGIEPPRARWHGDYSLIFSLSPRQRRVAELRAEGYSVANIAAILGRSEGTIKTHLNAVRRKLKVVSAVEICMKLRGMEATPFYGSDQTASWDS